MEVARLSELEPFVTKDGSTIRELAGPARTAVRNQSLAEASVPPGAETDEHYHVEAEELYYFVAGAGRMRLGGDEQDVAAGGRIKHGRVNGKIGEGSCVRTNRLPAQGARGQLEKLLKATGSQIGGCEISWTAKEPGFCSIFVHSAVVPSIALLEDISTFSKFLPAQSIQIQ